MTLRTSPAEQELAELASDTPEILVDLGVLRANIDRIASVAREVGVALRPHIKTHKMPQVAQMQVGAGAVGIQVAKLGEAEVMVQGGIRDVLVGYPIVGAAKLDRLASLAEEATISVVLDSLEVATGISEMAKKRGLSVRTLIEVDTGLRRLGREPGRDTADLAEAIASLPGIEFGGVFTHEGHVYTRARTDDERRAMTHEACAALVSTAEEIRARGMAVDVVSVGSAATFRFAVAFPGITEIRPGTYVFNDRTQIALGAATADDVAASVVATVVSRPARDRIVLDVGSKVLTSDLMLVPEPERTYGWIPGHDDWLIVRLSEEHGVVTIPSDADVVVGDRVRIIPNHICPAINLASEVTVVDGGTVADHWQVAGRGLVR